MSPPPSSLLGPTAPPPPHEATTAVRPQQPFVRDSVLCSIILFFIIYIPPVSPPTLAFPGFRPAITFPPRPRSILDKSTYVLHNPHHPRACLPLLLPTRAASHHALPCPTQHSHLCPVLQCLRVT
ncbi:hypothetical protein DENSPDRAFT_837682 [Dentipellis sp. KUC8613]|nr:hypothetical protein DENSPDRAFT_837682 [Dentipellis sp. KUC8613]